MLITRDASIYVATGWVALIYLVVMANASRRIHASIKQSVIFGQQNEALAADLEALSSQDALTGLSNRRALDQGFDRVWAATRKADRGVGMILCDIDFFKQYNDALGHQAGDECLKQVAEIIANVTRAGDVITARYGGEEFAIVLPECDPGLSSPASLSACGPPYVTK